MNSRSDRTCQAPGCDRPLPPRRRKFCSDLCQGQGKPRPSGWLLRQIPRVVAQMPGGGCSRPDLAAALHVRESSKVFDVSLLVCQRRGEVEFCGAYVVPPLPEEET